MALNLKDSTAYLSTMLLPAQYAVEYIVIDLLFISLMIPSLVVVAAITVPASGAILLAMHRFWMKKKITMFPKEWKKLLILGALFSVTEFMWFDAIGRIGASKMALLNVPLEPVAVIIFSFLILGERLRKPQIIGSCIVIFGVILSIDMVSPESMRQFGIGEIEAIIAAVGGGIEVVITIKFFSRYEDTAECSAFILMFTGGILIAVCLLNSSSLPFGPVSQDWLWLVPYSFIPMITFLLYFRSMTRIGASLTAVLSTASIMVTLTVQLIIVSWLGIPIELPQNMTLAVIGGAISIGGIYMVFRKGSSSIETTSQRCRRISRRVTPSFWRPWVERLGHAIHGHTP